MKHLDVAVAVVFRELKVLITRRKANVRFGGYWEFPGGKCGPGETPELCVARELWEELAIRVHPVLSFTPIDHAYPDFKVRIHPFLCINDSGEPRAIGCDELRWVEPADLPTYTFPEANGPLLDQVMQYLPAKGTDSADLLTGSSGKSKAVTVTVLPRQTRAIG